jgi:nitroreductase
MDVLSAVQERRSIRQYSDKPVEDDKLNKVLEAGRLSPSATNRQSWKFIIVKDEITRAKLTEATNGQEFVGQAPVIIAACGTDPDSVMACGQHRHAVDISIAVAYMILEAHEQGLGTCWLGNFNEKMVKEILGIPENIRVVTIFPLGYPAESPAQRPRKPLEEIVCYEKYR